MERRTKETRAPRRGLTTTAAVLGCLLASACSEEARPSHNTGPTESYSEPALDIPSADETTPSPETPAAEETPPDAPSPVFTQAIAERILGKACDYAKEEQYKEYPHLWSEQSDLHKYSDQYEALYGKGISPTAFEMELAKSCDAYARLTDHGAG